MNSRIISRTGVIKALTLLAIGAAIVLVFGAPIIEVTETEFHQVGVSSSCAPIDPDYPEMGEVCIGMPISELREVGTKTVTVYGYLIDWLYSNWPSKDVTRLTLRACRLMKHDRGCLPGVMIGQGASRADTRALHYSLEQDSR